MAELASTMGVDIAALRDNCKASFAFFCATMQDSGWFDPVHQELCDFVQTTVASGDDPRLMIVMPRGSLKSTIITKYLPVWLAINDPCLRTLIVTNTITNGAKKLDEIRSLFDSNELFRAMFPELLPNTRVSTWTSTAAEINRPKHFGEATFETAGVGTRIIGRHYNVILEDDTLAPDDSTMQAEMVLPSQDQMDKVIGWHRAAHPLLVPSTKDNPSKRVRIVVSTRWADSDLIDYIRQHEHYAEFDKPAEVDGQPVFSNFYNLEQLAEIKTSIGSYLYSALYLNKPIPAGDRLFREAWYHEISLEQMPDQYSYAVSIDPAISQKDDACDSAIVGCKHVRPYIYVNDIVLDRLTPAELIDKALDLVEAHFEQTRCIIIEVNAYQKSLCFYLKDRMRLRRLVKPIKEVQSRTAKETRIAGLQPLFENGQIIFRKGINPKLWSQLLQFPHGRLVDGPDALAMQLAAYRGHFSPELANMPSRPKEEDLLDVVELNRTNYKVRNGLAGIRFANMQFDNLFGSN